MLLKYDNIFMQIYMLCSIKIVSACGQLNESFNQGFMQAQFLLSTLSIEKKKWVKKFLSVAKL